MLICTAFTFPGLYGLALPPRRCIPTLMKNLLFSALRTGPEFRKQGCSFQDWQWWKTVPVDEIILTVSINIVNLGCVLLKSIDLYHFAF